MQTLRQIWAIRQLKKGNANLDDAFASESMEQKNDTYAKESVEERFCREIREFFLKKLDPFLRFLQPEMHE